jgi:hypothetical protein
MALLYSLYILDTDIAEKYFDINEVDLTGRPKVISPMDFGVSLFEDPTSIYTDNEVVGDSNHNLNPCFFGMDSSQQSDDMSDLEMNGYAPLY